MTTARRLKPSRRWRKRSGFVRRRPAARPSPNSHAAVEQLLGAGDPDAPILAPVTRVVGRRFIARCEGDDEAAAGASHLLGDVSALAYAYDGMVPEAAAGRMDRLASCGQAGSANASRSTAFRCVSSPDEMKAAKRQNAREKKAPPTNDDPVLRPRQPDPHAKEPCPLVSIYAQQVSLTFQLRLMV